MSSPPKSPISTGRTIFALIVVAVMLISGLATIVIGLYALGFIGR